MDYPTKIAEIEQITLSRPDEESNGKFEKLKDLTYEQRVVLLRVLNEAKPIGPTKFIPDYYIVFETTTNKIRRIRVHGNIIKGYDSDFSYEIDSPDFLEEF